MALHHHKRDLAERLLEGADTPARLDAAELLDLLRQPLALIRPCRPHPILPRGPDARSSPHVAALPDVTTDRERLGADRQPG